MPAPRFLRLRRGLALTAITAPLVLGGATSAQAAWCYIGTGTDPNVEVNYPCPGDGDQPVPAPVWVTTNYGPGYDSPYAWYFIKIEEGGKIIFCNCAAGHPFDKFPRTRRLHGSGFDSGPVPFGSYSDVPGISTLVAGDYPMYDEQSRMVGWLIVERADKSLCPPEVIC